MTKEGLYGWMAGFLDGEGCFTIVKRIRRDRTTPQYTPIVTACNTELEPLKVLSSVYKGKIYKIEEKRKDGQNQKWSDHYRWVCPVLSMNKLILDLLPFLCVKKKQAEILQEFLTSRNSWNRNQAPQRQCGGTGGLSASEIDLRELLRGRIRMLNTKGLYSRAFNKKKF
jgi:hypothetical protein